VNTDLGIVFCTDGVIVKLGKDYRCFLEDRAVLDVSTPELGKAILTVEDGEVTLSPSKKTVRGLHKLTEFPRPVSSSSLGPFGGWFYDVKPNKTGYLWSLAKDASGRIPRVYRDGTVDRGEGAQRPSGVEKTKAKAHAAAWEEMGADPAKDGRAMLLQMHKYLDANHAVGKDAEELLDVLYLFLTEGGHDKAAEPTRRLWHPAPPETKAAQPESSPPPKSEEDDLLWMSLPGDTTGSPRVLPGEFGNYTKKSARLLQLENGAESLTYLCRWQFSNDQWAVGLAEGRRALLLSRSWTESGSVVGSVIPVPREYTREVPLHPSALVMSSASECYDTVRKWLEELRREVRTWPQVAWDFDYFAERLSCKKAPASK
jgi:hypothetical protein